MVLKINVKSNDKTIVSVNVLEVTCFTAFCFPDLFLFASFTSSVTVSQRMQPSL